MSRKITETIERSARLQPQAAPVNLYSRPAEPARSPLWELASALSNTSADLKAWANKKKGEQSEGDILRGRAAFLKGNKQGYATGVRNGSIPAWASPDFQKGYKNAEGDYAGQNFDRSLDLAYEKWDQRESATPEQFDAWGQQFIKDSLKTDDPEVLRGLLPRLEAGIARKRDEHNKLLAETSYKTGLRSHIASATAAIETFSDDGLASPTGTNYEGMWADIVRRREVAVATGIRNDDFDKLIVESLISKAIEKRDPGILALLDKTMPGSDNTLRNDPVYREAIEGSEEKLLSISIAAEEAEYKQAERDRKARLDQITSSTISALAKDPNTAIPEDVLAAGEKLDPKFRIDMLAAQKALIEGKPEDQAAINAVMLSIMDGGGEKAVLDALKAGNITKSGTFENLLEFAKKRSTPQGVKLLDGDAAKRITNTIKTRTTPDDLEDPFGVKGWTDIGLAMQQDFEFAVLDWQQRNPNASEQERIKAINEIGADILKRLDTEQMDPNKASAYDKPYTSYSNPFYRKAIEDQLGELGPAGRGYMPTPPGLPKEQQPQPQVNQHFPTPEAANAYARALRKQQTEGTAPSYDDTRKIIQQPKPPSASGLDTETRAGAAANVMDYRSLDPKSRRLLEEKASKLGVDPAKLWERTWVKMPPDLRKNFESRKYDENGKLLNKIGFTMDAEGGMGQVLRATEAPDGYETVYARGKFGQPPRQLSAMTLGEVVRFQEQMLRNGSPSTAIGAGQFLKKTVVSLMDDLNLPPNTVFTPEVQNRMIVRLMERRGLEQFMAGNMTVDQFADSLAHEWAGLPLSNGKSVYSGDGLNEATIAREDVITALEMLKRDGVGSLFGQQTQIPDIYANIPANERGQFTQWNSDPIANERATLAGVRPELQQIVEEVRKTSGVNFVVASGKRDALMQQKAMEWGWSKKQDSNHLTGRAVDVWVLDENGRVIFDKKKQQELGKHIKAAIKKLGIRANWGGDWKTFSDLPHIELTGEQEV
ncbi:MAG: M15 family metallopeptidase [Proteobacteria bacterium]|nr:M15 family metallopeptidase [Pseudomonadota bacterium]